MSSVKPLAAPPVRNKRPRPDDQPLDASCEVLPKRVCSELPVSESVSSHLSILEEFYELEGALDLSVVESGTQEDLVSEMMKSLEKVIGVIEDPSHPQPFASGSAAPPLIACQNVEANIQDFPSLVSINPSDTVLEAWHSESDVNECSSADSESRVLFDLADDYDPGVPSYAVTQFEISEITVAESPLAGTSSNVMFDASMLQSAIGIYPIGQSDWTCDDVYRVDDSPFDYARDYCDIVSLDYCF